MIHFSFFPTTNLFLQFSHSCLKSVQVFKRIRRHVELNQMVKLQLITFREFMYFYLKWIGFFRLPLSPLPVIPGAGNSLPIPQTTRHRELPLCGGLPLIFPEWLDYGRVGKRSELRCVNYFHQINLCCSVIWRFSARTIDNTCRSTSLHRKSMHCYIFSLILDVKFITTHKSL